MATVSVYNLEGAEVGTIELSDEIFGIEANENLVHRAVIQHLAARRQGTQKAKTRGEVSGGGKKPWRQKGTGRARHGSTRSPQWEGGGVVFAPVPRDYSQKMNKKEKRIAIKSVLSDKVAGGNFIVLENLDLEEIKTKKMLEVLKNLNVTNAVIIVPADNKNAILSARNIQGVETLNPESINVFDMLKAEKIIATKSSVESIEEVYA